jgi:hypothetical protein
MDGLTSIDREVFFGMMNRLLADPGQVPFSTIPWQPRVHLFLFVHRVKGLAPGLYGLIREPKSVSVLRRVTRPEFIWSPPEACPPELPLFLLAPGDLRQAAQAFCCGQDIAARGCFSLGMVADFGLSLASYGPWFYNRLFWECGLIGQALYLEAEAAGLRGTGIGCFFDDSVHEFLGLEGNQYQSLYHFTVGGPVEDSRLMTLPAYPRDFPNQDRI